MGQRIWRYRRYDIVAVMLLIMAVAVKSFGQEAKPGAAPDAATPAVQKTQEAPAQEKNPVAAEQSHDHAAFKEKRFAATVGTDGIQHVEIEGGDFYFDPNYIVVKVNVPVEMKVKKAPGYIPHNIMVKAPEAGINFNADMGKDWSVIKFTPTKVGKYEMYCDKKFLWFKSHKERGMDGFIEVIDQKGP